MPKIVIGILTAMVILSILLTYILGKGAQLIVDYTCSNAEVTVQVSEGRSMLSIEEEKEYLKALKLLEKCE